MKLAQIKRRLADGLIVMLRLVRSRKWKYAVIRWGYGPQSDRAW